MILYELKNVKRYYNNLLALDIPSLSLKERSFYVVYGPNACGKSTLLNLLGFLDKPDEGAVIFNGCQQGPNTRCITLLMQKPYLFRGTVLYNVCKGLAFRSFSKKSSEKKAESAMRQLKIWGLRDRSIAALSCGEMRRVCIARSMVIDTDVLLLDEPTSNLDKNNVRLIEDTISSMTENSKKTIIMTTHDLHQAYKLTSNIIYLLNGRITDTPLWNIFEAELDNIYNSAFNGVKTAELESGCRIYAATEKRGRALIVVDPRNIIVSREAIDSSALNSLKGRVESIGKTDGLINLRIDVGTFFSAFVTYKSFRDMQLCLGEEVFLTFKASAVEVF
ncbi:MAG: ATP-binding cassette domain-containing protein [Candidatus Omnitrophota bacterium]